MVMLSSFAQACIVIGSYGVGHISIDSQLFSQFHALLYDHQNMITLMGFVETVIPWYDIGFDIALKFRSHLYHHGL